jgi:hypothetical protein
VPPAVLGYEPDTSLTRASNGVTPAAYHSGWDGCQTMSPIQTHRVITKPIHCGLINHTVFDSRFMALVGTIHIMQCEFIELSETDIIDRSTVDSI